MTIKKGTTMRLVLLLPALALASALAGCNGTTSSPSYITLPGASSAPESIAAAPSTLAFTTTGAQQSFTVSDPGNTGTLTASSTNCSGVATFTPTSGTGANLTVNVTSVAAGSCAIDVTDARSQQVQVAVGVTTTSGHISSH